MSDFSAPDEVGSLLEWGAQLAREYLQGHGNRDLPVVRPLSPSALSRELSLGLPAEGRPLTDLRADMERILYRSVRTGHPRFLNQLFGGHDGAAIVGEWITALINTSMYTYEVAPVATLMEQALIERMNGMLGFDEGDGVFAPGGSISNLMSLLTARHHAFPHVKHEGLRGDERAVFFVSAESHYSLQRAASVAGIGLDAARVVATDAVGRMDPAELERAVAEEVAKGMNPFLVVATAGTTVPGAFDPIDALGEVARRHGMWLHVDASYGGTVLFSRKHRHLMAGVELADSVAWNPHKMMGVPLACSATLMRKRGQLLAANGMGADYLFHGADDSGHDLGDMSLQCGRRVDALKLWLSWQVQGDTGYERRVDYLFALAAAFTKTVSVRPGFRLIREPQAANVCFRYLPRDLRDAGEAERTAAEHEATLLIRARLVQDGRFMVNYATLDGAATFRVVASNPSTTEADLEALLEEIETIGESLGGSLREAAGAIARGPVPRSSTPGSQEGRARSTP